MNSSLTNLSTTPLSAATTYCIPRPHKIPNLPLIPWQRATPPFMDKLPRKRQNRTLDAIPTGAFLPKWSRNAFSISMIKARLCFLNKIPAKTTLHFAHNEGRFRLIHGWKLRRLEVGRVKFRPNVTVRLFPIQQRRPVPDVAEKNCFRCCSSVHATLAKTNGAKVMESRTLRRFTQAATSLNCSK